MKKSFSYESSLFAAGQYHVVDSGSSYRVVSFPLMGNGPASGFYSHGAIPYKKGSETVREKAFDRACRLAEARNNRWNSLFGKK